MSALAMGLLTFAGSCSSEHVDNSIEEGVGQTKTIKIQVVKNAYTRADDANAAPEEQNIASLHVALFNSSSKFMDLKEATKGADGKYSVDIVISRAGQTAPGKMLAFANLSQDAIDGFKSNPEDIKISDFKNGNDFMMSSSVYFDASNADKKYTELTESILNGTEPAVVYLERVATKVSAISDGFVSDDIVLKKSDGSDRKLTLALDKWGVTATEKQSFLIKSLSGSDVTFDNWNSLDNFTSHWAKSVNYGTSVSFPAKASEFTDNGTLNYLTYSGITNTYTSVAYYHESTRPEADYAKKNAVASLVIAGHYNIDGATAGATFFKYGDFIYTETEYYAAMAEDQNVLYSAANTKIDATKLKEICEPVAVSEDSPNVVTLQLKKGADLTGITDASGAALTDAAAINAELADVCSKMEMAKDGKCYFVVPIENIKHTAEAEHTHATGCFGLVRNHYYKLNVKSIKGLGSLVADENGYVDETEQESPDGGKIYSVKIEVNIVPWTVTEQDINIDKTK